MTYYDLPQITRFRDRQTVQHTFEQIVGCELSREEWQSACDYIIHLLIAKGQHEEIKKSAEWTKQCLAFKCSP